MLEISLLLTSYLLRAVYSGHIVITVLETFYLTVFDYILSSLMHYCILM